MKIQIEFIGDDQPDLDAIEGQHNGEPWALVLVDESNKPETRAVLEAHRKRTKAHCCHIARWDGGDTFSRARAFAEKHWPGGEIVMGLRSAKPFHPLRIGVVVTCHADYLQYLPACLASIDAETAGERILVCDGFYADAPDGWKVIQGDWRDPNAARNAGLWAAHAEWLVFWDADDVMPEGYIVAQARNLTGAPTSLAISYPGCTRGEPAQIKSRQWDHWSQRESNPIVTCAAFRREALRQCGGWIEGNKIADDLAIGLKLTALGHTAKALPSPTVNLSFHGADHRSKSGASVQETLWNHQTFHVVTIHCGRDEKHLTDWTSWLASADLPPNCALTVIDSSGSEMFRQRLGQSMRYIEARFQRTSVCRFRYRKPDDVGDRTHYRRHAECAEDYNKALVGIADDFVLFVDDDTLPPANALSKLHSHFTPHSKLGAVGGVYVTSRFPGFTVGSIAPSNWTLDIPWPAPEESIDVSYLGGGCTLFANWALKKCLPFACCWRDGGTVTRSWDNDVSEKMRAAGYSLRLDGKLKCQHNFIKGG